MTTFAAIIFVLTLLQSVYASASIGSVPSFIRKLTAEIFVGVIAQLASLIFGLLFALGKLCVFVRKAERFFFWTQVICFFIGSVAFLIFSIEMFRSVTIS
jgi:hypothetical protein